MKDSKELFLDWLKKRYPSVYDKAVNDGDVIPADLGDFWSDLKHRVTSTTSQAVDDKMKAAQSQSGGINYAQIATAIVQARANDKLIKLNIKRAEQGLPPIDATSAGAAPTLALDVGSNLKTFGLIGLGILALVLLLRKK